MAGNKGKGKEYGKDATDNPAVSKYARLSGDAPTGSIMWEEVSGPLIKAVISAATEDGCAVIFGKTRDGGALSFTLLGPGAPVKRWPATVAQAESFFNELLATIEA